MRHFRLLTRTRQVTEYSCGACALQAVLSYWGREVEEKELMKLLHTTPEEGTYPDDIVRGARALGLAAEARDNLTLDEVEEFTKDGDPMIALAQVWRSEKNSPGSVADDWDDGHYVVVLGVDKDYIYFQDPYARMGKAFTPRVTFMEHWHQVMGGDVTKNPRLMQLGILIRGDRAAPLKATDEANLAAFNLEEFGSLNLIVTHFSRQILPYDFISELRHLWSDEKVRPDAFLFLRRDNAGGLSGLEGSGLEDDQDVMALNTMLAAAASRGLSSPERMLPKAGEAAKAAQKGDFGLSAADIQEIAQQIAPGHSAIAVLVENVWERRYKSIAAQYGGTITNQRLISPEALAESARKLASAAD